MNANQNSPSPQDGKVIDEVILIAQKIHKAFPNLEDRGFVETISSRLSSFCIQNSPNLILVYLVSLRQSPINRYKKLCLFDDVVRAVNVLQRQGVHNALGDVI